MLEVGHITIEFKSMKDLGNVYKVKLSTLKEMVSSMADDKQLREAELDLKELLAIVKNKQEAKYARADKGWLL